MPDSPETIAISEHLSLVQAQVSHAEALHALIMKNKTRWLRDLHWPRFIEQVADVERFLAGCAAEHEGNRSKTYVLIAAGEPCGVVSFNSLDLTNRTAYLGYWLDSDAQGQGHLTRAVKALIDTYAHRGMIQRFVIKAAVRNTRSNRLAQRCGFQHEGTLRAAERIGDDYLDQNLYALIV